MVNWKVLPFSPHHFSLLIFPSLFFSLFFSPFFSSLSSFYAWEVYFDGKILVQCPFIIIEFWFPPCNCCTGIGRHHLLTQVSGQHAATASSHAARGTRPASQEPTGPVWFPHQLSHQVICLTGCGKSHTVFHWLPKCICDLQVHSWRLILGASFTKRCLASGAGVCLGCAERCVCACTWRRGLQYMPDICVDFVQ